MARALPIAALAALGALALTAPARADWTSYGGNPEHQLTSTEKVTAPLSVLWKHATNVYSGTGGNRGGPVISRGVVYFPSKNRLYAVDINTGQLKWSAPEADPNDPNIPNITATPCVGPDAVYVPAQDGSVTKYNLEDGRLERVFRTDNAAVRSSPLLIGKALYFGSDDDYVYCVDADSLEVKWKSNDRGKPIALTGDVVGAPTYYGNIIYINSADNKMWAFQADSGRLVWEQRTSGTSLDLSPVALNNRVYIAGGNTMYQFRLRGGTYRSYPLNEWVENDISTTPIITENHWFFGDRSGYFYAFQSNGKPVLNTKNEPWKVRLEGKCQGTPVMTQDTIYVSTDKGFLYGIDLNSGRLTWIYRTEPPKGIEPFFQYYAVRAPMAVDSGKLFVVGDDGTLSCFAPNAGDDEKPIVVVRNPARGTEMSGFPPMAVAAYMWDEGSGINPATVSLKIDNQLIEEDEKAYYERAVGNRKGWVYNPIQRLLTYTTPKAEPGKPDIPLPNGRRTIEFQVADWAGNVATVPWSFVINNSIPRGATRSAPKTTTRPGGTPGGMDAGTSGAPGSGYPGGPGGPGQGGFRSRQGGYQYNNRNRGGYGYRGQGNQGGMSGYGGYGRGGGAMGRGGGAMGRRGGGY